MAMIARFRQMDKNTIKWTRLSCGKFRNNEVRLQLHALAYEIARTAWAMMAHCTYLTRSLYPRAAGYAARLTLRQNPVLTVCQTIV